MNKILFLVWYKINGRLKLYLDDKKGFICMQADTFINEALKNGYSIIRSKNYWLHKEG